MNRHLSEIISLILEPVANAANGAEVDSTGDMLDKIDKLNGELSEKLKKVGVSFEGNSLFSFDQTDSNNKAAHKVAPPQIAMVNLSEGRNP